MLDQDYLVNWRKNKIFLVHIPKTGGTSLFSWLAGIHGPDRCCEHIESLVLPTPSAEVVSHLAGFDVVSGHLPIDYRCYLHPQALPITIVREPEAQFFSHVNHILAQSLPPGPLAEIQSKLRVSIGHFLEHATPGQLEFFESAQSKPLFGGGFDWRSRPIGDRIAWLQAQYAAVFTTETLDAELDWLQSQPMVAAASGSLQSEASGVALFDPARTRRHEPKSAPRLNVRHYRRETLTPGQSAVLQGLLQQDRPLHHALVSLSLQALPPAASPARRAAG